MRKSITEVKIEPVNQLLKLGDKILTIGSCFADSMGSRLTQYKFDCMVNPYGVVFNPISIVKLLTSQKIDLARIVEREGVYCHLDYHFDLRANSKEELISYLNSKKKEVNTFLSQADYLILTLGTAQVYEWGEDQTIVANCHKVPQKQFVKRVLSLHEMKKAVDDLLLILNSKTKVLLTVSPVRHAKDGLVNDQMSKSLLRVLCGLLVEKDQVSYFPSYEIMMDELRDYRYYKDDMLHPTELSEEIIWDRFVTNFFDEKSQSFTKQWKSILSAIHHRPFNPKSEAHQRFLVRQLEYLSEMEAYLDVENELQQFKSQLL